ncbi:MAG: lysophospholipid acyltransferase family protein [Sedimentisphaerales bacterium]|nr:lysophospholipid acyltransferase family protein [Sedimentisphaerales bacterium]
MHKFLTTAFAYLFNVLLRFVCGSNRLTVTRADIFEEYAEQGGNIFTFWHSRLFFLSYFYVRYTHGRKLSILVSLSRDGDYGAALVRKLKLDAVRGSTSRGGQKAVRGLAAKIAEGNNVAITPDGPRGPALRVSEGVIKLAQITGARIVPVSFDATRKRLLKSWDRFVVVIPFGRVHVAFGEPIEVPKRITVAERAQYREQLERTLRGLDDICIRQLASRSAGCVPVDVDAVPSESQTVAPPQRAGVR